MKKLKIAFCLLIIFCIFYKIVEDTTQQNDLNQDDSIMELWGVKRRSYKPPAPPPPPPPIINKTPTPAASINGYDYKGCYNDNSTRALKNHIGNGNINDCVNLASAKGYDTVGLQYYSECWAGNNGKDGNNYSQFGTQTNTSSCNINAVGGWTNMVYKKNPPPIPYNGKEEGNNVWYIPGSSSQYYADLSSRNLIESEKGVYLYRVPTTDGYKPILSTGPIPPP